MNFVAALGSFLAITLLFVSAYSFIPEGAPLWEFSSLLFVIGGVVGAILMAFPLNEISRIPRSLKSVWVETPFDSEGDVNEIVEVGKLWFRGDRHAVESHLNTISNAYLRAGIQLVIDQVPLKDVLDLLHWRIERLKSKEQADAKIFRTLGFYSLGFGGLGTLFKASSILVVSSSTISTGILLHVILPLLYGASLALIIFFPIATKLERLNEQRVVFMNMVLEGISLISQKRSPSFIRETLRSFMARFDDELGEQSAKFKGRTKKFPIEAGDIGDIKDSKKDSKHERVDM